ncbi:hypothetical protein L484_021265 [Morus notabilis]|uniref:Uncharacterized protein n=1 Tax=Morus notabilis TaxID=981085 RepID=W9RTA2_9ROSA|nr:hypothetical protein L484_021265 [Morus notabilis]
MFGFAPHALFWREIRKIAMVELLSNRRPELLKHIQISKVASFVKELPKHCRLPNCSFGPSFGRDEVMVFGLTLNMILRMLAGEALL